MNDLAVMQRHRAALPPGGETAELRIGYIPLLDCAPVLVAAELGFAASEGIRIEPVRETSWANIRDRVIIGHFDAAQMLAPMPIASTLGIGHLEVPMVAPMALGLGGNAVTVSRPLWEAMRAAGARGDGGPRAAGEALKRVVDARRSAGRTPLSFGMVYPFSCHNYELRYWLAASGIRPDTDVRLAVIPPPFMVDALRSGHIDGYCVGEPWNSLAVEHGVGVIATTKARIWRLSPEKVLGARRDWAENFPHRLNALMRALYRAALWCDDPANHDRLARLLARPDRLNCDPAVLRRGLAGRIALPAARDTTTPEFLVFAAKAATFPWTSHALWLYSQMVRWGQAPHDAGTAAAARSSYRPDLYRAALRGLDVAMPAADAKIEGALTEETPVGSSNGKLVLGPDGFFDGIPFDPDCLGAYIAAYHLQRHRSD